MHRQNLLFERGETNNAGETVRTRASRFMQIKSKNRVAEHGEVFTNPREVNAMLDMVEKQAPVIENETGRVLEPACGEGVFLQEILRRRLAKLAQNYKTKQPDYEFHALLALGSLYGIDILPDNAEKCRANLLELFASSYQDLFKKKAKAAYIDAARFILEQNIVWGDAQTMLRAADGADSEAKPIIFAEWAGIPPYQLQKRDFVFEHLVVYRPMEEGTLFASDTGAEAIIPKAIGQEMRPYLDWGRDLSVRETIAEQRELL